MRWHSLVCCFAVPALAGLGCSRLGEPTPAAALPAADQVSEVRVTVRHFPERTEPGAPYGVILNARADVAEALGWLGRIDWSQRGTDLAVVTLPSPDGEIAVVTRGGTPRHFGFYWDGGVIANNRLVRGADMAEFRRVIRRHCY